MSVPARTTATAAGRTSPAGPPVAARAWRTRPGSRERLAGRVAQLAREAGLLTLEHRLMPHGRGSIDVLLVGPAGITVVDALLLDRPPRVDRLPGGFAEPRGDRLLVGGRDHTGAVRAVEREVLAVGRALSAHGHGHELPAVRGALCVPDGLALAAFTELRVHDVLIDAPQTVAFLAARPGPVDSARAARLAARLARAFPAA